MGLFDFLKKKSSTEEKESKPSATFSYSVPSAKDIENQASVEAEEIAKMDANCRKSQNGLSVSQILLLEYCKKGKYPNPEGGYQRFWWFEYGVRSVGNILSQLEARGFIRFASPIDMLPTLKVDELKGILSNLGLSTSGKKADLVKRISENTDNVTLTEFIKCDKYTLTELGEKELSSNGYVYYLHAHKYPEVSVWDVNKNADINHWKDYVWGQFNKCSLEYASKGQWGLYRNVRFSMAEFLFDEGKNVDSFAMYGEVCFYDVNGMDIFIDYDDPADLLIEGILLRMKKASNEAGLSEEKMKEILNKRVENCQPVKRRVPKGQMTTLILDKMNRL